MDQIPQLHTIRQDLLIQAQVEKRLKELAEAEKPGTHKQKSLRGGPVEVLVPKLNGRMNMSCQARRKSVCHMTSYPLFNG